MVKKLDSKKITADIKLINQQLAAVRLKPKLKAIIDQQIFLLQNELKDLVVLKKIGSFASNSIYNFDKSIEVDLLAVKYVNFKMYQTYNEEIQTKEHFTDCWNCELNEIIFKHLTNKFSQSHNIVVDWHETKIKVKKDSFVIFKYAISIKFYHEGEVVFSFLIRTALTHLRYLPIICDKKRYFTTTALEFISTYKVLNKLLVKKLDILFFYFKYKFKDTNSRKEILMMKIFTLSEVQQDLTKNEFFKKWITKVYEHVFPSQKAFENLFDSKNIYYKKQKPIEKMYRSIKLKNLTWVFNRTYTSTRNFLEKFLSEASQWVKAKNYTTGFVYFWYDSIIYLQNSKGSSSLTKKRPDKKYEDINMSFLTKNIYPSDKNIGVFLVLLTFYKFPINYFRRGK